MLSKLKLFISILIIIGVLFHNNTSHADGKGTAGGQFLKIHPGARPEAMGGAFVGLSDDINAIYWNPSGLGYIKTLQMAGLYNKWFEGINYEYLGYVQPIKRFGTLGLSLTMLQIGGIEKRVEDTDKPIKKLEVNDLGLSLSYGKTFFNKKVSLGANIKYIRSNLSEKKADAFSLDIGGLYKMPLKGLSTGISIQNLLASKLRFKQEEDELSLNTKIGFAYKTLKDHLNLAVDYNISNDNDSYLCIGVEYWIAKIMALRMGYKTESDLGNSSKWRAGLGFKIGSFNLDCTYAPYGELGDTYRVSFSIEMDTTSPTTPKVSDDGSYTTNNTKFPSSAP
ncbi:MAG: PorV/PorQ family protein [bacterium]|nr:PorV/PorQ family protein [bacterium]